MSRVADSPSALLGLAIEVAVAAGDLLVEYRERTLTVRTKSSDTDPVSEADEASEQLIADRLLAARPNDGFLGEEEAANRPGGSGLRWVVDPLDGTVNYLYGTPLWCVSIACEDGEGPLVGVVHNPGVGETFIAARDLGAFVRKADGSNRPLAVTQPDGLATTLLATGFAYDAEVRARQGEVAAAALRQVRDLRRGGAAALDLAWVAAGRIDAYLEFGLKPWDWAAGRLLVQEAGGKVSALIGEYGGEQREGLVAGAPATVDRVRGWLQEFEATRSPNHPGGLGG